MNSLKNQSDHVLLPLIRAGNESAYLELYDRYKVLLHQHAYKKLGNLDDADDIVQELFIQLWERRSEMSLTTNVAGYLFTAIRNRIINHFHRKQRQTVYLDSLADYINQGLSTTDTTIREMELNTLIEQEIEALPPRMREVFRLSRMDGLSHKEISERLGTSEQTVSKQITKALKVLRLKWDTILSMMFFLFHC